MSGPLFRLESEELIATPAFGGDVEVGTIVFIVAVIIIGIGVVAGFVMYYQQSVAQRDRDGDKIRRGAARKASSSLQAIDGTYGSSDYLDNEEMLGGAATSNSYHNNGNGTSTQQNPSAVNNINSYMSNVVHPNVNDYSEHNNGNGMMPLPNHPNPPSHSMDDDDGLLGSTNRSSRGAAATPGNHISPSQGYSYPSSTPNRGSLADEDPLLGTPTNGRPGEQEDYIL